MLIAFGVMVIAFGVVVLVDCLWRRCHYAALVSGADFWTYQPVEFDNVCVWKKMAMSPPSGLGSKGAAAVSVATGDAAVAVAVGSAVAAAVLNWQAAKMFAPPQRAYSRILLSK